MVEESKAGEQEGGGGMQRREREGEDEPRKSEDDSEHVIKHQYTSDGRAAISAYSVIIPLNKSLSLQILLLLHTRISVCLTG